MVKYRTEIVREGEWLGPVDFSYFEKLEPAAEEWRCQEREKTIALLRKLSESVEGWRFSPSGFNSFEVLRVGMYDGWPFWFPHPAVLYSGPLGPEVVHWDSYGFYAERFHRRVDAERSQPEEEG